MLTIVIGSLLVLILGYQGAKRQGPIQNVQQQSDQQVAQQQTDWMNKSGIWWLFAGATSVVVAATYLGDKEGNLRNSQVGAINVLLWCCLMTLVGIGFWRSTTMRRLLMMRKPRSNDQQNVNDLFEKRRIPETELSKRTDTGNCP